MEATALFRSLQEAVPGARLESAPSVDVTNLVRNIERQAGFEVPRVDVPAPDAAAGPTSK